MLGDLPKVEFEAAKEAGEGARGGKGGREGRREGEFESEYRAGVRGMLKMQWKGINKTFLRQELPLPYNKTSFKTDGARLISKKYDPAHVYILTAHKRPTPTKQASRQQGQSPSK